MTRCPNCGEVPLTCDGCKEQIDVVDLDTLEAHRACIQSVLVRCTALGISLAWPEFDNARRLIGKE